MKLVRYIITFFIFCITIGCNSESTNKHLLEFSKHEASLSKATKLTIFSIDSIPAKPNNKQSPNSLFHNYKIKGSIDVLDKKTINEVSAELKKNIYKKTDDPYIECFNPRHGIRIYTEHTTKDFLICFECSHLHIFNDSTTDDYVRVALIMPANGNFLNKILTKSK